MILDEGAIRSDRFTAWILRASMVGFTAGCRLLLPDVPRFGDLVKVPIQENLTIFGLIYDVAIQDDLAVRQLIIVNRLEPEVVLDQQQNRMVPIELGVLTVGYQYHTQPIIQGVPPQPPITLDLLIVCGQTDLRAFTENLTYLHLILTNSQNVPADELLVTNLVRAGEARPPEAQYQFLLAAGRKLARILSADLIRLDGVLRRIKP